MKEMKRLFYNCRQQKPKENKILATNEELDRWIASHYGLTLQNIPTSKPEKMPRVHYERLKKYTFKKEIKTKSKSKLAKQE